MKFKTVIVSVLAVLLFCGCSTKKNNLFTRNYHNLTSYYNVYWNGNEALKDVENTLKENATEDYFNVLPVLKFSQNKDTASISAKTERVIEKASKTIAKHSIIDRGKEYVRYIDDAYLLMAKGFFFQREFSKARQVLNLVMSDFSQNPEKFEAMLWAARTYTMEEEFGMSIGLISLVEAQAAKALKKETRVLLPQVFAEYYIQKEEYSNAEPYLNAALLELKGFKNRDQKARIYFILGQIEQKRGNYERANQYYKQCQALNPPLAMSFNSTINRALCYNPTMVSSKDILKSLNKLLKDPKNAAYFGRIYYVLGEMFFADGDEKEGVEYLKLSIQTSQEEKDLLYSASKHLAEYFYSNANYISAAEYYELAAQNIETSDTAYYTVSSRSKYLSALLLHYESLKEADTTKALYHMSQEERLAYGKRKVEEYNKKQEEERKNAEKIAEVTASASPAAGNSSSWYFYNSQSRATGYNEFVKRWGRRRLEDLWCFSQKPAMAVLQIQRDDLAESLEEDSTSVEEVLEPTDPLYYLQNIPQSDSALAVVDSTIEHSLYNVALVYYDNLNEADLGESYFLRLYKDYPESQYIPSVCENLCKIYHEKLNTNEYNKYAAILASKYAGSEQDRRINDPLYLDKLSQSEESIENLYQLCFLNYAADRYPEMLQIIAQIEEQYPINNYNPQLNFLKAIALAHTQGYYEMIHSLQDFKVSYPGHELEERVDALLAYAQEEVKNSPAPEQRERAQFLTEAEKLTADSIAAEEAKVVYEPKLSNSVFNVVLLYNTKDVNVKVLNIKLEDFNRKMYKGSRVEAAMEDFDGDTKLIVVSVFRGEEKAMDYISQLKENSYVFSSFAPNSGYIYAISEGNLSKLRSSKDIEAYKKYYSEAGFREGVDKKEVEYVPTSESEAGFDPFVKKSE